MRKWKSLSNQTRKEIKVLVVVWIILSILVTLLGYTSGVGPLNAFGSMAHYMGSDAGDAGGAFSQFLMLVWRNGLTGLLQLLTLFFTIVFFGTSIALAKKVK